MKYTFLLFLMLWRHRPRDQNGPKFHIRSKSLREPFSKNIFKPKKQQQQQHLFKHDKNYSGADVVVYLRS